MQLPPDGHSSADARPAGEVCLENARFEFTRLRRLAEAAMAQVPGTAALHRRLSEDTNSIGILVRHLAGNLRSRWTDFLTTDGEKPNRNRESEFDPCDHLSREALLAEWDAAFELAERVLSQLEPGDLRRSVRIRGEALLVQEAIQRQIVHLAYHTGQIVLLARAATPDWISLSIPRGASPDFRRQYKT
jgi:uncharacterized damage-inducible protein DinB